MTEINILIVDDEILAIESVKKALEDIPVPYMGDRNVFHALNISEGKEIILSKHIEMLLCDIEMPNGSGLELIRWVCDQGFPIECVMITCFADFDYIKCAMKYGVIGYVLKPIDVDEFSVVISKAYKNICNRQNYKKKQLIEYLRSRIVDNVEPDLQLQEENKDLWKEHRFWTIMAAVKYRPIEFEDWDSVSIRFVMSNVVREIFDLSDIDFEITLNDSQIFLFVDAQRPLSISVLTEGVNKMMRWFEHELKWSINGYLSEPKDIEVCLKNAENMIAMNRQYSSCRECILYPSENNRVYVKPPENLPVIKALLEDGEYRHVGQILHEFFHGLEGRHQADAQLLERYMMDILQLLYQKFGKQHRLVSEVLDEKGKKLYLNFTRTFSVQAMLDFADYILEILKEGEERVIDTDSICNYLKEYITRNIGEPLTRDELSSYVHLNADYLNRIFKKKEGISLMVYVVNEKMEMAKKLMLETSFTIKTISEKVGYENYSYFTTSFKKYAGVSAKEFRMKNSMHNLE